MILDSSGMCRRAPFRPVVSFGC